VRALPFGRDGGRVTIARAILIALIVIVADRATKFLIMSTFEPGESVAVVPGFFSLTYVRNPGAAFGLLAGSSLREPLLILFAMTAVAGLSWLLVQTPADRAWKRGAAAGIIGGAIGNLYDRISYGSVVDFLDVYVGDWHWPAFNVADSAITVGVAVLLLASVWRTDDVPPPSTDQERFDGEQRAAA
jgi:signal peptidase II